MYRDNPLAFWSETADNSLNWKLQPELNYPELPWKLQTTKLNYNYLEYRSKTAGNSLLLIKYASWIVIDFRYYEFHYQNIAFPLQDFECGLDSGTSQTMNDSLLHLPTEVGDQAEASSRCGH